MKVAIVDNGINESALNAPVVHINSIGGLYRSSSSDSHGTICAKIIETYGCVSLMYDIICLDQNGQSNINTLVNALNLCCELDVDIINISAGIECYSETSDEYIALRDVCARLIASGKKIYAAQSNDGFITIPADYSNVISVEQTFLFSNSLYSLYRTSDVRINGQRIIKINKQPYRTSKCNSYACAFAVALATAGEAPPRKLTRFLPLLQLVVGAFLCFTIIPIPVIRINCNNTTVHESTLLAFRLKSLFFLEGYHAAIVSDSRSNTDYCPICVGRKFNKTNTKLVAIAQKPDIIISLNGTHRKAFSADDVLISINKPGEYQLNSTSFHDEAELFHKIIGIYR